MAHSLGKIGAASAALALLLSTGTVEAKKVVNRSVESVHQPVVERTDYVLDVGAGPHGLAFGEGQRLVGWFEGLNLGYGDTIMLDEPAAWHGGPAEQGVAAIVSRYGMLIAHDAPPVTVGRPAPGTLRVVVSRATARVDGCPDWTHDNSEYAGSSGSNYGCATAVNLAAMIANPEDLVVGQQGSRGGDAAVSIKAIKTFRDATPTGSGGLKAESTGGK
ncbi:CpaD family pilus assembly lipoprotein [uncultured Sphingomonas sp.]|uniref:CpaD family pilus assembly protein n=1 Tax=uncultured Sphingomonas sp. TaxID=158754 RepID=UPI002632E916|nr:CpaD family pilus assembly lipoprotein [uncultured Sphingomonas sp.]